jgi:hypothetical protein
MGQMCMAEIPIGPKLKSYILEGANWCRIRARYTNCCVINYFSFCYKWLFLQSESEKDSGGIINCHLRLFHLFETIFRNIWGILPSMNIYSPFFHGSASVC